MNFHKESGGIALSVSELAQIAYPLGDIRSGFSSAPRVSASARARFLEAYGSEAGFRSDVAVSYAVTIEPGETVAETFSESEEALSPYSVHLSGRIDGVSLAEGQKTVLYMLLPTGGYDAGGRFRARFRAESHALAALYALSVGEEEIELSTVTVHSDGSRLFSNRESCTVQRLSDSLSELLRLARPTTDFLVRHRTLTVPKAGEVAFPYSGLREGQEELIRSVYRTVRRGGRLFAQAPTGIGKTISTLYPAVRALGSGYIDKIFYLTAKASTRREAFSAAGKLYHAGARLRTCIISAKEQVCLCEKEKGAGRNHCNPFDCPYADGYYERAPAAILSLLSKQSGYTRASILETAREYGVCPYELSLDLSEKCDIVICDYNYVFDPRVYFRRYFGEERTVDGQYAFLIDEGHNLADRARDMYSASLHQRDVKGLLGRIPDGEAVLKETLNRLLSGFDDLKSLCSDTLTHTTDGEETGFWMSREAPRFLDVLLEKTVASLKDWQRIAHRSELKGEIDDLLSELRTYRLLRGYYDEKFLTMVRVRGGDIEVRLFCLDPSAVLDECLSRARASVVFSATLTPLDYFTDLLGGTKKSVTISLPSPFPRENLCVAVCDAVSTRFEDRSASYRRIASLIAATVSGKAGNYIVYFPSYAYLSEVARAFTQKYPRVRLILQKRGMTPSERDEFLDAFCDDGKLRVGFCVLGGSFSEGVDLPGGRLIGSVIVGVGLAGLSEEGNILRDYYENKCERGYDYAYTFPGMNRVLQAAGRVIRTDRDEGVIVLIDDRYAQPLYRTLFPPHWEGLQYAGNSASLAEILRRFWGKAQK
ncbi:MAG: ATP-dependent DNA helicase [Clostridia bacterium]|nr:ATP-dependent DNA helicase [Clostridia bacterium]